MGCIIKYKGQSIPEEQFLQYLNKQIAINQLFESDSNLANAVYEALGLKQDIKNKKTGLLDYFLNVKKDSVFQELIQIGETLGIGIEEYESNSPLQANWNGENVIINKTYGKATSNVIAHEVVHGILHTLTNNDYNNSKLNLKLEKFKTELFDYIEKKGINNLNLPPELRILKLDYIKKMSNQEIVTYAFTDSQFSDFLASIKTDAKVNSNESFWNKLINIFNTALKELGFTSKLDELIDILNTEVPLFNNVQITPQQKQQALQAYSQYLDTLPIGSKQDSEDFKSFINNSNIRYSQANQNEVSYTGDLAIEEKIAEEAYNSKDEKIPTTLIGKFIQSIRNLFRNLFKERDNISRLIRNLNQSRIIPSNGRVIDNPITPLLTIESNKVNQSLQEGLQNTNFQKQTQSQEGLIASEKTIRDLTAKISDRIGISYKIESDRTKQYKGKIENNVAYINLAYATLDTPIHEILGHPIIRAIKNIGNTEKDIDDYNHMMNMYWEANPELSREQVIEFMKKTYEPAKTNQLYQNLLKELDYGKGKEVLDRIKRDYNIKNISKNYNIIDKSKNTDLEIIQNFGNYWFKEYNEVFSRGKQFNTNEELKSLIKEEQNKIQKYTLEEQQEEAVVELLGLMTANKLDAVKDGKLISLLKRLLKEMKQFIRSLINQKEVEIDKLPDNMTINDLSDLLAYSNSKLILPGYEVEYTTPDNEKFKTYQEASNHISELAKDVKDVDLSNIALSNFNMPDKFEIQEYDRTYVYEKRNDQWYEYLKGETFFKEEKVTEEYVKKGYINNINKLQEFIEKNKEYEQSKEIIEEWKKVNNIQYNPEEIYSRGQEFSSVVGAYSSFDVNLMMQNLLSHIEDNEKAGGKFAISAFTKPIDRKIGHLEGGGGKIKFKLYPQSNDILWAANTDVYSGSVWDASEKVNKDKKSELLGVSYTKYPSLNNVNSIQPNLAAIVDDLSHHHNELAISLNFSNFEIEVDEDVPYQTKKIIENVNKILQQKRLEEVNSIINKLEKEC